MKKNILFFLAFIFFGSLLYAQAPSSPILVEPPKEANILLLTPTLSWNAVAGADCYFIYITTDTNLSPTLETCMSTVPSYQVPAGMLITGVTYYWYVKACNSSGWGVPSAFFSFSTTNPTVTGVIDLIQEEIDGIVQGGRLSSTQGNILNNRLEQASHQAELGNRIPALVHMILFKFRVLVLRISDQLPVLDAEILNEAADGVIDLIQDLSKPVPLNVEIPKEFSLMQNYPNPFNPSTTIEYTIPENSVVTLKIYDILGKEVAGIVNKYQNQGSYIVNWNASGFSSGVYIYKLTAGSYTATKKMILSK